MPTVLLVSACARDRAPSVGATPDSAAAQSMLRDVPVRLTLALKPAGSGQVVMERAARVRAPADAPPAADRATSPAPAPAPTTLTPPLPSAEPAAPPEGAAPAAFMATDDPALKPPIPRGLPVLPRGGRGGRVALDVRVDERGEVTDAELVETDADSATVAAAVNAAYSLTFYPAILGERRVAVWTRQVFEVKRGR